MKYSIHDVLDIPELHEQISSRLTRHDLLACVQVSKAFSALFLPPLWENINMFPDLEGADIQDFVVTSRRFLRQDIQPAVFRNGHLIKSFKIEDPIMVNALPETCRNLTRLCICDYARSNRIARGRPSVTPQVLALMRRNPRVKRFRMDTVDGNINEFMETVARSFPVLQSLTIGITTPQLASLVNHGWFLDNCPSTLSKLTLIFNEDRASVHRWHMDHAGKPGGDFFDEHQLTSVPVKLLKLEYGSTLINFPLIQLVKRLNNLQTLRLEDQTIDHPQMFAKSLERFCPRLVNLNMVRTNCLSDEMVYWMLSASLSGWRFIEAPVSFIIGPKSFDLMVQHSTTTLENFGYQDQGGLGEEHVLKLLTLFPKLKSCQLNLWCSAALLVQPPEWACSSLIILRVVISKIPRPDIKLDHSMRSLSAEPLHHGHSMEESRQLQRQVYARLGSLTELEYLILGTEYTEHSSPEGQDAALPVMDAVLRVNGYQYECLEFTLVSGLSAMAGLKKLRVLDLARMSHRIRVPELEWMAKNWPQLETIVDLFPMGDQRDPAVEAWLQDNGRVRLHEPSNSVM